MHTDSVYLRNGITKWLPTWKRNGWMTSDKKPVKNADLWTRLDSAARTHTVQWFWVKGHAGHPENERADELACRGSAEAAALAVDRAPGDEPRHGQGGGVSGVSRGASGVRPPWRARPGAPAGSATRR